jgi:Ca2+-binding RTX toxin-like protein
VNLQARTATATGGFDHVEVLTGGAGGDTLVGADLAANVWNVTGKNAGKVGSVTFTEVENLTGGAKADRFAFAATGPAQAYVTGIVNGGGGTDRLDYGLYPAATPVTVNLQTRTAPGTGGFQGVEAVTGSQSQVDTLVGADADNTWDITDTYFGTVNGTFEYRAVENLTGGIGQDRFVFGKSVQSRAANITGGAGADTLDYASYPQAVGVNLFTQRASGVVLPTNLPGLVNGVENVTGSTFADSLTGDDLGNVLVGLAGDDLIDGGRGNDLLVGGSGQDTVGSGDGEDILIGSIYGDERDPAALGVLAREVMRVWSGPGLYMDRVKSLRDGTNPVGVVLTIAEVTDDGARDELTGGGPDLDWFLAHETGALWDDTLTDWVRGIEERN